MLRRASLIALIAVVAIPVAAQGPAGWKLRTDGSHSASAPEAAATLKFTPNAKGFHVSGGPGAIFWNPAHTVKGVYAVTATFTLTKPAAKVTDYGLVFGAADVEGATPTYVYF